MEQPRYGHEQLMTVSWFGFVDVASSLLISNRSAFIRRTSNEKDNPDLNAHEIHQMLKLWIAKRFCHACFHYRIVIYFDFFHLPNLCDRFHCHRLCHLSPAQKCLKRNLQLSFPISTRLAPCAVSPSASLSTPWSPFS